MIPPIRCKILLVDDDPRVLNMLQDLFREEYETLLASSGTASLELARRYEDIAAVVMDIKMAGMDGITAAREIRKLNGGIPVIFHTGYPGDYNEDEIDEKEKPFDYVLKGEPISRLERSVRNAVETYNLKKYSKWSSLQAESDYGLIGHSAQMQEVYHLIRKVAVTDTKVMIVGETGSGKELVAQAIHRNSPRRDMTFAVLSCTQRPADIIESELFGHKKGAFTGAIADRMGLFEYANGGTLFLDEIGDLDLNTQSKLLRVLESGEYHILGSPVPQRTDIRLLCATNKNLEQMMADRLFKDDLYFRLKAVKISLPPLRQRKEDIPLLAEKFKDNFIREQGLPPKLFDRSAIAVLLEYDWPGNVRQLLDTVESLIILCDSDIILAEDVGSYLECQTESNNTPPNDSRRLAIRLREFRRNCIIEALHESQNNISAAAASLGIDRSNLRKMIRDLKINLY